MDISKRLNLNNIFLFLFLIVFPFGQIIRIGIVQPIDIIVGLGALTAILKKFEKPEIFKYLETFLFIAAFSWVFSFYIYQQVEVLYGLLYLLRLAAYFYFFIYIWNFVKRKTFNSNLILDSLLSLSLVSSIFGWIQYFTFPSIKPFFVWGWDEHLFRLVGTFLDPTFLGLIIVFGLLLSIHRCIDTYSRKNIFISLFLLVSLAFTYSRASYLAFFAGLLVIAFHHRKLTKKFLILILGFLFLMLLLPTSKNNVLNFTRSFSAINRLENYKETTILFKTSPVFGVGYNNLCLAKAKFTGFVNFSSHACSGSDSSILFILATMGIVGAISFVWMIVSIWNIGKSQVKGPYFFLLRSSFFALLVHSLFSNSLFYSWTLGYLLILLAITIKKRSLE